MGAKARDIPLSGRSNPALLSCTQPTCCGRGTNTFLETCTHHAQQLFGYTSLPDWKLMKSRLWDHVRRLWGCWSGTACFAAAGAVNCQEVSEEQQRGFPNPMHPRAGPDRCPEPRCSQGFAQQSKGAALGSVNSGMWWEQCSTNRGTAWIHGEGRAAHYTVYTGWCRYFRCLESCRLHILCCWHTSIS